LTTLPPSPRLPEYDGNSLLNLIATLVAARGGTPRHRTLEVLHPEELAPARNIVFLLIDGLGNYYLEDRGRGGALVDHLAATLTSVFPSTTASAISTTYTGASPAEHGLTGWFGWFPRIDAIAAPLPFRRRGDEKSLTELGWRTADVFDTPSVFEGMDARSIVVSQARIVDSDYSRHFGGRSERRAYENLAQLVEQIEAAVRSGPERKYVYAYYPEFDTVAHRHGVGSAQAAKRLAAIDAAFADLLRRLAGTDTFLLVSADHGFIDTPPGDALLLDDYPQLRELMVRPLSGEPRVAFCHVREGGADEFMQRARAALGDHADVRASRALLDEAWFGPGVPHQELAQRIGDVALVMRGRATIKDWVRGEKPHRMIGNHGGLHAEELMIPLVVARMR
jgi:hypothetical protein